MSKDEARSSRIPGFYKLGVDERLEAVQAFAGLSPAEVAALKGVDAERLEAGDKMIENVAGLFHLPVGIAANFRIDGEDRLIPMVIEEPSVVAASSHAAKLLRGGAGIRTSATAPVMIGQVQLVGVPDPDAAIAALTEAKGRLVDLANQSQPRLVGRGGGARELIVRELSDPELGVERMVVVHLHVDVCDAMGANLVNQMVETLAPQCESLSGGEAYLRILSNLADQRLVSAEGRIPVKLLAKAGWDGAAVAARIEQASLFAEVDPYRAATHNKGIMNGVDAFLLATGQDWRAVEAGAHAFASRTGRYGAMATWRVEGEELVGRITLPMQVGTVGGVTKVHPVVKVLLKVVDARGASDVGRVAAAVGLAQNLAAIKALATEGIQRGHMSLHARNIAAAVGAKREDIDRVVAEMIRRKTFTHAAAESILDDLEAPATPAAAAPPTFGEAELEALREAHWPEIEAAIEKVVPREGHAAGSLEQMVWYQLDTGGKRLRAVIPLAVSQALGRSPSEVVPLSAALELLHNATLTHDAVERRQRTLRGRDALWVRHGVDQAINAGDGMFYQALQCLEQLPPAHHAMRVQRTVVEHVLTVVRAQIELRRLDSEGEGDAARRLELERDRIGGLFTVAIIGAAVLAGVEDESIGRLEAIGGDLGLIFMAQDELLGLLGGRMGARRGASLIEGRESFITRHAMSLAPAEDAAELRRILDRPPHETHAQDVSRGIELLYRHGALDHALDLVASQRAQVEARSADLPERLVSVLRGLTDVFLAPLLIRIGDA